MILTATLLLLGQRCHSKNNRPTIPREAGRRYSLCRHSIDCKERSGGDGGGPQVDWLGDRVGGAVKTTETRAAKPENDPQLHTPRSFQDLDPGTAKRKTPQPLIGYGVLLSGRRGSNPRHSAWEADALPTELLPLARPVERDRRGRSPLPPPPDKGDSPIFAETKIGTVPITAGPLPTTGRRAAISPTAPG